MTLPYGVSPHSHPRRQADQIVRIITQEGSSLRGVLLGKRREGKTDLFLQVQAQLFEKAEGAIPFFYSFGGGRDGAALARHFVASFCQQVRAFLMRQDDLLREPVAGLERELEKAGLPLSLTEMARSFLATPPERQLESAATLPEQFLHREDRPVCLLWDDAHALESASPFFSALQSHNLYWLVTGKKPFLSQVAGRRAWPLIRLEPFSRDEALVVADKTCQAAGVRFAREAWEQWCDVAGTSSWLVSSLIGAAETYEEPLSSIEDLGRLYFQELASGTLGNWLARRFEQAVPDRLERASTADFLAAMAKIGMLAAASPSLSREVWDGLVAEEWAEETAAGPRISLDTVQRDWLFLAASGAQVPSERSRSRAFQDFLLRVRKQSKQRAAEPLLLSLRSKLGALSQTGLPKVFESPWMEMYPPRISSISNERAGNAELFWCYGFRGGGGEFSQALEVLLIVLCEESPSAAQVDGWRRQLEREARLLPKEDASTMTLVPGSGPHQELWLLVPPGTTLLPSRLERRFFWDSFERLLDLGAAGQSSPESYRQP